MPLPTPNKGEEKSDFISRCMDSEVMKTDYEKQEQRLAVCYSQWRRKHGDSAHVTMTRGGKLVSESEVDGS